MSLGMTFTVGQMVAPLHRVVLVIAMVVLNAVVIPAAAWGIIGAQLHGNPVYLGPAITFALVDFILPLALAIEIGHRAGATTPAPAS